MMPVAVSSASGGESVGSAASGGGAVSSRAEGAGGFLGVLLSVIGPQAQGSPEASASAETETDASEAGTAEDGGENTAAIVLAMAAMLAGAVTPPTPSAATAPVVASGDGSSAPGTEGQDASAGELPGTPCVAGAEEAAAALLTSETARVPVRAPQTDGAAAALPSGTAGETPTVGPSDTAAPAAAPVSPASTSVPDRLSGLDAASAQADAPTPAADASPPHPDENAGGERLSVEQPVSASRSTPPATERRGAPAAAARAAGAESGMAEGTTMAGRTAAEVRPERARPKDDHQDSADGSLEPASPAERATWMPGPTEIAPLSGVSVLSDGVSRTTRDADRGGGRAHKAADEQPADLTRGVGRVETGPAAREIQASDASARVGSPREALTAQSIERVVGGARTSLTHGGMEVRLRLHPDTLGELRVQVRWEGGVLSARLEAATPAAREALESGSQTLRAALHEQGIPVDQLRIDVRTDLGPRSGQRDFESPGETLGARLAPEPVMERDAGRPAEAVPAGRLDIRI